MHTEPRHKRSSIVLLRLLTLLLIGTGIYGVKELNNTSQLYDGLSAAIAAEPHVAKKVRIGTTEVTIPTYDLFKQGELWALVSKAQPLTGEANYTLVNIPVAHGDEDLPMKVAADISDELQQLVNAAEADNEPLMVSSAYRSLQEQKAIYDGFVAKNGKELASLYVLPVGASEHHTGLVVDFSSVSDQCAEDSDTCSLSQSAAAWLAQNAPKYGFILRYPDGQQSITGVTYEPWHYRFVGKPLARAIATSDLTYDEIVQQIAPGYAGKKSN